MIKILSKIENIESDYFSPKLRKAISDFTKEINQLKQNADESYNQSSLETSRLNAANVFVKNLQVNWNEEQIKKVFEELQSEVRNQISLANQSNFLQEVILQRTQLQSQ